LLIDVIENLQHIFVGFPKAGDEDGAGDEGVEQKGIRYQARRGGIYQNVFVLFGEMIKLPNSLSFLRAFLKFILRAKKAPFSF